MSPPPVPERWPPERARAWYEAQPWLVGCNYIPRTAVNQLEMWQAESFDHAVLKEEIGWAARLGMNTLRVFLHDVAFATDPAGFLDRVDRFLDLCAQRGIRPLFVFFDDCWFEGARPGTQPPPVPGMHNSRWLQSPGRSIAADPTERDRLKKYVVSTLERFGGDGRVLAWDLYNEVGNFFLPTLALPALRRLPRLAVQFVRFRFSLPPTWSLLEDSFRWAREVAPVQPLTAGVWFPHPSLNRRLLELSDFASFHHYGPAPGLEREIRRLQAQGRPLFCTEYMARTKGSRLQTHLPIFRKHRVACYNWGLVRGKTQTVFSWEDGGRLAEPRVWYHDLLHPDGIPYDEREAATLRSVTERGVAR